MGQESRKSITAPGYLHTDGHGADADYHHAWIEYRERGPPPSSRSLHSREFPSIVGNFASGSKRREIHTYQTHSTVKETK